MPDTDRFPAETVVRDPVAAALLVDARRNRFLQPFLGRACGVTEAARVLGVSPSLVSYWVARLHKAGLLRAADRAGTRTRAWRASADAFVVALRDVPMENEDAILSAQMDLWSEQIKQGLLHLARRHSAQWKFRIEPTPQGVRQTLLPAGGSLAKAPFVNERAGLNLTPEDAAGLRAEMRALMERYTLRSTAATGPGRRRILTWMCAVEAPPRS